MFQNNKNSVIVDRFKWKLVFFLKEEEEQEGRRVSQERCTYVLQNLYALRKKKKSDTKLTSTSSVGPINKKQRQL